MYLLVSKLLTKNIFLQPGTGRAIVDIWFKM